MFGDATYMWSLGGTGTWAELVILAIPLCNCPLPALSLALATCLD